MLFPITDFGSIHHIGSGTVCDGPALSEMVRGRRRALLACDVGRGDRIVIAHGGTAEFFADLFAVWSCGASALCLNQASTAIEIAIVVRFTKAKLVLVDSKDTGLEELDVPVIAADIAPQVEDEGNAGGQLDDEALVLFTSGTTGEPKGVVHTFRSLIARVHLNAFHIGLTDMQRTLCVLPTHFGHGLIGNALTPLMNGCDLVLSGGSGVAVARQLGALIDTHRITFMSSVPSFWKLVLRLSGSPDAGTLRRVHVGSAPLSSDLWRQIVSWSGVDNVMNMYGITETANWIGGASAAEGEPADGWIGKVWGGAAAVKLGGGEIRNQGEGELLVQTPSLMQGYLDRPDLTEPVLRDGWFHTGDIGRIEADGNVWLTGRAKYEINRSGIKVHPEDIDLLLERHDCVSEACAFAIPDEASGEIVGVAIVADGDATIDVKALKSWCGERLVRDKLPDRWFVLDEIPKTDRGKVNRFVVADACRELKATV